MLPALNEANVKLFAVGIGDVPSARTFAKQIDFPAELLHVDESEKSEAYAAAGTRNTKRDASGKQIFEGVDSMLSKATMDAVNKRGKADLDSITGNVFAPGPYKPLMPKGNGLFDARAVEKTLVQGGTFIFDGGEQLFAHYDKASGVHADLDEVVRVATSRDLIAPTAGAGR